MERIYSSELSGKIMRVLRGSRSREQLARIIKADKSTIYKWEESRSQPTWKVFVKLLDLNELDVKILIPAFGTTRARSGAWIVSYFLEGRTINELADVAQVSRFTISNALHKKKEAKLSLIFNLWHAFNPGTFFSFINLIDELNGSPKSQLTSENLALEKHDQFPFLSGLLRLCERGDQLEVSAINVANWFKISLKQSQELLDELTQLKIIESKNGRYQSTSNSYFDSSYDFTLNLKIFLCWSEKVASFFKTIKPNNKSFKFTHSTGNVSEEAYQQINIEHKLFSQKIRTLIRNDRQKSTRTLLIVNSLTDLEQVLKIPASANIDEFSKS